MKTAVIERVNAPDWKKCPRCSKKMKMIFNFQFMCQNPACPISIIIYSAAWDKKKKRKE